MTTATTTRMTDWYSYEFAVITSAPYPSVDRPTYSTTGHDVETCPAIKGRSIATGSLADFVEAHRACGGETVYLPPWPCTSCVSVRTTGREVAFEAPRPAFGTGPAAPKPEVVADRATDEAREYARTYAGTFEFMLDMRLRVRRGFNLTPKMIVAILRCKASDRPPTPPAEAPQGDEDARRATLVPNAFAGSCSACQGTVAANAGRREKVDGRWIVVHSTTAECQVRPEPTASTPPPAAAPVDVPAGKYAVDADAGHLSFYQVRKPTEGKWQGYTFVDLLIGAPGDWRHQGVSREQKPAILAKIAADPQAAAARFGHEFRTCGQCDAPLSHERSRAAGYGEVCAGKRGWAW